MARLRDATAGVRDDRELLAGVVTRLDYQRFLDSAEKDLLQALAISDSIGAMNIHKDHQNKLSDLYEQTGDYRKALEHYKKATALKDTLFTQEKNKEITRKEMNYEFDKKETAAKAEQDKKDVVAQQKLQKQKIIRNIG